MFYIKTKLKKSNIHGIGLFAGENIRINQKVYAANKKLDLFLSKKEFSKIALNEQGTIKHYGYFDKRKNKWHLAFDDIRFCNHSLNGNLTLKKGNLVARRYIPKGEELTQNYGEFEQLRKELGQVS